VELEKHFNCEYQFNEPSRIRGLRGQQPEQVGGAVWVTQK